MAKEPERIADLIVFLKEEPLNKLLIDFVTSNSNDANFTFWWNYMKMISIMLLFTRAERDGVWQ